MTSSRQAHQVLLIEDDPNGSQLHADLIREMGNCKVDVITRIENSIDWIARSNYDLIVLDDAVLESSLGAGGSLSSLVLLERVKRISPDTSVVILSAQATVEQAVAAMRIGAEDYLQKPFNLDTFKLAVKRGLDRNAIFGETGAGSHFLLLLNSCQMISASFERENIFGIVRSYLSRELKSSHSAIFSIHDGNVFRFPESGKEAYLDHAVEEILDIAIQVGDPLKQMIETNEYFRFVDRGQLTPSLFVFRFNCAGGEDYFCVCLSPQKPPSTDTFEIRLKMLKAQIEVTSRNIQQFQGIQHLVYVDDVTGLYNTRYLHYILDREIAQSRATGRSFAVLFIDADQFKGVNDVYGHLIGTRLLNELGNHLRKFVREKDTVFRYGGDEFVAVLSHCDLPTAQGVAERIRSSVEQESFLQKDGLDIRFTVTIGVALFPEHAASKQEIVEAADQAMYGAKRKKRNSILSALSSKGE